MHFIRLGCPKVADLLTKFDKTGAAGAVVFGDVGGCEKGFFVGRKEQV